MEPSQQTPAPQLARKLEHCCELLRQGRRVLVAFSGGVDSAFLLALAARTLGASDALAGIGVSASLPQRELAEARQFARALGVELVEVQTGELEDPKYAANPANRCYFCKSDLFGRLTDVAKGRGFDVVASGANADDAGDFRPGLQAGCELGVRNPLMDAGLTKDEIRQLSRHMGLATWDKPAMACLASRVPYGEAITEQRLGRIERSEQALRDLGFPQVRVRDHDPLARIEVLQERLDSILAVRDEVLKALKANGYTYVTLDLAGFRSGSSNEVLRQLKVPEH